MGAAISKDKHVTVNKCHVIIRPVFSFFFFWCCKVIDISSLIILLLKRQTIISKKNLFEKIVVKTCTYTQVTLTLEKYEHFNYCT